MNDNSLNINDQLISIVSKMAQFISDNNIRVSQMAHDMGYPRKKLAEVINGKRLDVHIIDNLSSYLYGMSLTIHMS